MRTKKVEIAVAPVVASIEETAAAVIEEAPIDASGEFEVVFHFQKRENAESFIAKTKTLGYDNSELREV